MIGYGPIAVYSLYFDPVNPDRQASYMPDAALAS